MFEVDGGGGGGVRATEFGGRIVPRSPPPRRALFSRAKVMFAIVNSAPSVAAAAAVAVAVAACKIAESDRCRMSNLLIW